MKAELIRNCSHGSEIATYLFIHSNGKKEVVKAASTLAGMKNLRNEQYGWAWYQEHRYPDRLGSLCQIVASRESYLKIQISYIEGKKPDFQKGLVENVETIRMVTEQYCRIWPRSCDVVAMHGDLSLDNILVNSAGVHIIDWEHFTPDVAPWGFDLMYCLLESLYFGMRRRLKPRDKEIEIICEQIKTMYAHKALLSAMLEGPLQYVRGFVLGNRHLWGEQLSSFVMKLPIVAFSRKQVSTIDKMIISGLI